MNLNPFAKVRTTSEIVATFDKTLSELEQRIELDAAEIAEIERKKAAAIEAHRLELEEHDANAAAAMQSSDRATRIYAKIKDLIA